MSRPRLLKNPVALSHCLIYGHTIDTLVNETKGCTKCGMTLEEIRTTRLPKQQTKELEHARI